MDISRPNNFPRVEELARRAGTPIAEFFDSLSVQDFDTNAAIADLYQAGYLAEPHTALAWRALVNELEEGETGVFLGTAHPAKFGEAIKAAIGVDVPLPPPLAAVRDKTVLSKVIPADYAALRACLMP